IAAYQSGAATRPTTLVPLDGAVRFFQFGSLFESDPLASLTGFLNGLIEGLAFLATAVLFASAVFKKNNQSISQEIVEDAKPSKAPNIIVTAAIALSMALA